MDTNAIMNDLHDAKHLILGFGIGASISSSSSPSLSILEKKDTAVCGG